MSRLEISGRRPAPIPGPQRRKTDRYSGRPGQSPCVPISWGLPYGVASGTCENANRSSGSNAAAGLVGLVRNAAIRPSGSAVRSRWPDPRAAAAARRHHWRSPPSPRKATPFPAADEPSVRRARSCDRKPAQEPCLRAAPPRICPTSSSIYSGSAFDAAENGPVSPPGRYRSSQDRISRQIAGRVSPYGHRECGCNSPGGARCQTSEREPGQRTKREERLWQ